MAVTDTQIKELTADSVKLTAYGKEFRIEPDTPGYKECLRKVRETEVQG